MSKVIRNYRFLNMPISYRVKHITVFFKFLDHILNNIVIFLLKNKPVYCVLLAYLMHFLLFTPPA